MVDFAQRLRDLRDASGLTLRQLAAKSGYSQAALSQAESGRVLPSWELIAAFTQACGDDPLLWRHRWELAHPPKQQSAEAATEPAPAPGDTTPVRSPNRYRHLTLVAASVAALVLGVAAIWLTVGRPDPPDPARATRPMLARTARDNTDPYADGCRADEKQLDWHLVYRKNGGLFGSIILMYSAKCQAAWGYLNAPNSTAWTIHIITHRVPAPGLVQWQFSGDTSTGSWGNVLSTARGCVYTEAYVVDKSGEGPHARTACIQPPALPGGPGS